MPSQFGMPFQLFLAVCNIKSGVYVYFGGGFGTAFSLQASFCSITDTGLADVAQYAGDCLEQICVTECACITLDGVKLLKQKRPLTKVVHNAIEQHTASIDVLWELGE